MSISEKVTSVSCKTEEGIARDAMPLNRRSTHL